MSVNLSGVNPTTQAISFQKAPAAKQTVSLAQAQDSVSFSGKEKVVKEAVEKIGKMAAVKNFFSKIGGGIMKVVRTIGNVLAWPFKAVAKIFTKKAPEAAKAAEKVAETAAK